MLTRKHEETVSGIDKELAAVQRRADEQEGRWQKQKEQLQKGLRKASR